jgi:hypothetical protein
VRNLSEILDRIAPEIKVETTFDDGRADKADIVSYVNEAKDSEIANLVRTNEKWLHHWQSSDVPTIVDVPAGDRLTLPVNWFHLTRVEILLSNGEWIPIRENRLGESSRSSSGRPSRLGEDTEYFVVPPHHLYFDPPVSEAVTAGVRLWYERLLPDLIMGKFASVTDSTHVVLSRTIVRSIGQLGCSLRDDEYNGFLFDLVSGTGAGQRVQCADYAGLSQVMTLMQAMTPLADATTVFAMVTPFTGQIASVDTLIQLMASWMALTTKFNEDGAGVLNRYNVLNKNLYGAIEPVTPGNLAPIPFDWANG